MRIWVSGGGTAGHIYPALAVLAEAGSEASDVLWLGTRGSIESDVVARRGLAFQAIGAGPLVGVGPLRAASSVARRAAGTLAAWRLAGRARPDAVLVTGGYVGVPTALAARARRVPVAVFLPDVRPGRAVALVSRLADRVACASADAVAHLPRGKAVVTGYPVRASIRRADRRAARQRLGVAADRPVVLVFGGSQGARRLNEAVAAAAVAILARASLIHVAGRRTHAAAAAARESLSAGVREGYRLFEYLHDDDMADALAAADLVVSRAGAAVLGEYPARGLPAILVPLPIAGGHQWDNARALETAGAALVIDDERATGERLSTEIARLLDDPAAMERMSRAARALDRPDAARAVWQVVVDVAAGGRS